LLVAIVLASASLVDAQTPCESSCRARFDACESTCRSRPESERDACFEACRVQAQACTAMCTQPRGS